MMHTFRHFRKSQEPSLARTSSSGASRPRALHLALWTSSRSHCAEESPWEQRVSCTSNSFAVSDFCYRRHQVKESTGMLPQRSHPFTTWDIGLVISIMEDGEQLSPIDKLAGKHLYFAHLGTLTVRLSLMQLNSNKRQRGCSRRPTTLCSQLDLDAAIF